MNPKSIVTAALLILAAAGVVYVLAGGDGAAEGDPASARAVADALPADGVVVYYFHGHKRCATCNRMEALAEQTLQARFGDRMARGSVAFRAVNVETDATRHFVTDYELTGNAVVMVERRGGEERSWRRLDSIWEMISDDESYGDYIAENLAACLDHLDRGAG